jgi:hypothetical protein
MMTIQAYPNPTLTQTPPHCNPSPSQLFKREQTGIALSAALLTPTPTPAGLYMRTNSITDQVEVSPFQSIPMCFWWCIVTLVTVGYGDVFPVTVGYHLVSSSCVKISILLWG